MHTLNIKIEDEQYEKLRDLAYKNRKSLAQIIREMIEKEYVCPGFKRENDKS